MKKSVVILLLLVSAFTMSYAQTVEEGVKFLYYEKAKSARETLEQVVNKDPKNANAIYWLGQVYIFERNVPKAKALYQKALNEGVNDPYIWVGMGNVELLENGDINSAKQKFEQAITATTAAKGKNKGKADIGILTAIGRANAQGGSKHGDPEYGIEKLNMAASQFGPKDPKDPEVFLLKGICYLKMGSEQGGAAVEAFREAIAADAKYAKAPYRIGMIYQSQHNWEMMNKYFEDAAAADPAFAPLYLNYFQLYQNTDVNVAKGYLDKYMQYADKDCHTEYFAADYLYRAGKFQESIDKGKSMENGECKDYHRVNLLYAYNYDKLNQPEQVKQLLAKYFATEESAKIQLDDYLFAANALKKIPGNEEQAVAYWTTAIKMDSSKRNQLAYMDSIANIYKAMGNAQKRFEWLQTKSTNNPNPNNTDIYALGDAARAVKNFDVAEQMFRLYIEKYPDQSYGYNGLVTTTQQADSTGARSEQPILMLIDFLGKDQVKNAPSMAYWHAILAQYYTNTKKDINMGIAEFQKAAELDPSNPQYAEYLKILQDAANKANAPRK